ncbi:stage III sporulation protein AF [Aneurinibacillus sp. Ricciae_BoGa-3]|uniref:stage III sporulation protein AF n=1 Tax=Aneurinibacillus sp. Ricciae_BoGa-3 TaxID=3022697 RepID=UPI00234164A9|nr:stage III sporulation protein AF [Aneurinibacillus sp. Ricciae_BoGa-3]WCK56850.1 stage III sporulation protein AF [Aneurinibacillus sp. Ricciae_BoGa-3]
MITLWIKRLILLVLLATFIDLLLPSNAYQKYIRLVMGLCILLAMLTPLLSFFGAKQITFDSFVAAQANKQTASLDPARIKALTDELIKSKDDTAAGYVQSQVEEAVKKQVEDQYAIPVASVQVKLNTEADKAKAAIQEINVVLDQKNSTKLAAGPDSGANTVLPVKPVQPVKVNQPPGETNPQGSAVETMGNVPPIAKKIEASLTAAWDAPVHVQMPAAGEGG